MQNLIKRNVFQELKNHLKMPEITMIIGPRQCGKTTLMRYLVDDLEKKGEQILFLNLDIEEDYKFLRSQKSLLDKIRLEFGEKKGFVFLDEIQRKKGAGSFLKGLYDMNLPYKFIVSGSGNIELKEKISESLMGRKRIFQMRPILWREFVNFKTEYKYSDRLHNFFEVEKEKARNLLTEYLSFGGYPRVVTATSLKEKQSEIQEIFNSYITKDIVKWLRVEKIEAFEKLFKLSATQIGNLVDFASLAGAGNISVKTLKNYLWYLQKTFILEKCSPFFRNKKKEIVKSPIFYFYDLGLRNYAVNRFALVENFIDDAGFLFENFIFNELKNELQNSSATINFWRTKSQAEVDFIIDLGGEIIPVEAKFKNFEKPKIEKSLQSFIKKYSPAQAFVVNKNLEQQIIYKNTKIKFIPFWEVSGILKNVNL